VACAPFAAGSCHMYHAIPAGGQCGTEDTIFPLHRTPFVTSAEARLLQLCIAQISFSAASLTKWRGSVHAAERRGQRFAPVLYHVHDEVGARG
jgi:hypothetical protein